MVWYCMAFNNIQLRLANQLVSHTPLSYYQPAKRVFVWACYLPLSEGSQSWVISVWWIGSDFVVCKIGIVTMVEKTSLSLNPLFYCAPFFSSFKVDIFITLPLSMLRSLPVLLKRDWHPLTNISLVSSSLFVCLDKGGREEQKKD